ncbi:MAG: glycosyltransferase [Saprospiraceae bacterium]
MALFYAILMLHYQGSWRQLPIWDIPAQYSANTSIDIIIPARNEASNIEACLHSIFQNEYPLDQFQVWVVDDFSEDGTAAIVKDLTLKHSNLNLIQLKDSSNQNQFPFGKKQAIASAIAQSKNELIVATDADCQVPDQWLNYIASYYQAHDKQFIAAPVNFMAERSLLERFQSLDFVGMMLITGAGIAQGWMHMSNGANLAYTRKVYQQVDGFQGIDHLASGDDMLLMQKIAHQFPGSIGFLKNSEATVSTKAQATLKDFVQQRVRWASKSNHYPEWRVTAALAGVFFFCWSILGSFLLIPLQTTFFIPLFLGLLLLKASVDYYFLKEASHFFQRSELMRHFWPSQILHILYICFVGLLANLRKEYAWKGRKVR